MQDIQTYYIHDNGGRPFKVEIISNPENNIIVDVYNNELNTKILSFTPLKVFVGKSERCRMTEYSGGHGKKFDGNSILLELGENRYEFIGESIFSFATLANIVKYQSPVGNNDVPYPYAIDLFDNIYLLVENVMLKYSDSLKDLFQNYIGDPYDYYYEVCLITSDIGRRPLKQPKIKNFDGIVEYFIDDDQYTLKYTSEPDYEETLIRCEGQKMYIRDVNGEKKELIKEMYNSVMRRFGELINAEKLINKYVDHKRIW